MAENSEKRDLIDKLGRVVWPAAVAVRWIAAGVLAYSVAVPFAQDLGTQLREHAVPIAPELKENMATRNAFAQRSRDVTSNAAPLAAGKGQENLERPAAVETSNVRSGPTFRWAYAIQMGSSLAGLMMALWAVVALLRPD